MNANTNAYGARSADNVETYAMVSIGHKEKKDEEIGIGGTPFFIEMFLSKIEQKGLKFDIEKGMVVTAGGWKRSCRFNARSS